jgi:hypothetical protein
LHTNKQNNNILQLTNYTKTKYSTQNKNDKQKQTKYQPKKKTCYWMRLVGVVPSSSTCPRK